MYQPSKSSYGNLYSPYDYIDNEQVKFYIDNKYLNGCFNYDKLSNKTIIRYGQ